MNQRWRRIGISDNSIITSILLADLLGFLVWVLIGAFSGSPMWWLLRALLDLVHASLLFDLGFLLLLWCLAVGIFRKSALKKSGEDAWTGPGTLLLLLVIVLVSLWFVEPKWMAFPASTLPHVPLEAASWRFVFPTGCATRSHS